ncbi:MULTISPECIES: hypothetical protein [Bacillales]|uniref:hypothetical protein n=1 Tax=Bacillales TaxID=1385 RepID=UPI00034CCD8B|nr:MULTISPECIES: hypothetical protein [Bacillales]
MKWDNRDWKWLTGIIIALMVIFLSLWLWNINQIDGYFSVLSSAVSIALALVAIFIALKQDTEGSRINNETKHLLATIDAKLNNVNDRVQNLDVNSISTKINSGVDESIQNIRSALESEYKKILEQKGVKEEISLSEVDKKVEELSNELKSSIFVNVVEEINSNKKAKVTVAEVKLALSRQLKFHPKGSPVDFIHLKQLIEVDLDGSISDELFYFCLEEFVRIGRIKVTEVNGHKVYFRP